MSLVFGGVPLVFGAWLMYRKMVGKASAR